MKDFIPTIKENPRNASSVSHRLMLKAGLIRQTTSGIFAWLPLGTKVINKITQIIQEEQNRISAQEFIIPMIQTANLWKTTGRYNEYGKEMLRIKDQYDRELVFTPTNEELMTSLFQQNINSYRELPQLWYTIQWKFRDEIRPRAGVMRSREFLMLDTYSFDLNAQTSQVAYQKVFLSFLRIFDRLGLSIIPAKSSAGLIGGDVNHEFILPCDAGETELSCPETILTSDDIAQKNNTPMDKHATCKNNISWVTKVPTKITKLYENNESTKEVFQYWQDNISYTREAMQTHNSIKNNNPMTNLRGIELGHTFYFGTKYTQAFAVNLSGAQGENVVPHMGSYGIGITRLVAAIIETNYDQYGIVWPQVVAPFVASIINLQGNNSLCCEYSQRVYNLLHDMGIETILDNSQDSPGVKLAKHDLIGLPVQLIIGPQEQKTETILFKNRKNQNKQVLQLISCLNYLKILK